MSELEARMGERLPGDTALDDSPGLDRKRIVILLRSVVIATCAYLVFVSEDSLPLEGILYVLFFAGSNVVLALSPRRLFVAPHFGPLLLLADTAIILFGLSWSHGLSQDLLLVYFFTVFLLTVGETLGQIAIGSALIGAAYGYWLWMGDEGLRPEAWVRLPFFFLVAIFYASLIEQLKKERRRRRDAENQNEHLRLMLDLASVFSESHATREFVRGIGRFIEGTCPGLECSMGSRESAEEAEPGVSTFALRAHGKNYGTLCVRTAAGRELLERESWLCQMVAHSAAGALYAAEQSDAARSAVEAKEQFLANVSHEFRTPLHAILGYIDMIEVATHPRADAMVGESIERLRVNTWRLQNLLEEILSFAEIRAGRRSVRTENVSLEQIVGDLIPMTRELLSGKPVSLSWEIPASADEIRTDARKLQRALSCLLSNAAKFTEKGAISVTAQRLDHGAIELEVADTGIGIAAADLDFVFDDFRQIDGSFTRRYGGLGLGLALARELVVILDGTLELESTPEEGTKVRIRIPSMPAKTEWTALEMAAPEALKPIARLAAAQ
jgi:signal transduction histidine kinase